MTAKEQEKTPMSKMTIKKKRKRLPKGQRTHVRRLKQEARAAGTVYKPNQQN